MIETDSNYQGLNRMDDPIECSAANSVLIEAAYLAMKENVNPWWWNYITATGKEE